MVLDASPSETDERLLALRRRWLRRWWMFSLFLWASVGTVSIWSLRRTWHQLADYFTWAALRYGLAFHRLAAIGLGLCLGLTVVLLIKETRYFLFGLSKQERQTLEEALDNDRH
ncbi:MAG: hypothetical protein ACFBSG_17485 [Leptolyngbyaceae cyanobacterium]